MNKGLVKYALTDAQLDIITDIIPALDKAGITLRFGTYVGKYPQTIIFDLHNQDGILIIPGDCSEWGSYLPEFNGEEFSDIDELESIIAAM